MNGEYLKEKSECFKKSISLLQKKKFYIPIAHCAYYSCFVLIQYVCIYKKKDSPDYIKRLSKGIGTGSHDVMINEVGVYIKDKEAEDFDIFNSNIAQLKSLRVKADYKDLPFVEDDVKNAINLCNKIKPVLDKYANE